MAVPNLNPSASQFVPSAGLERMHIDATMSPPGGHQVSLHSLVSELWARVQTLEHGEDVLLREVAQLRRDHDRVAHTVFYMGPAECDRDNMKKATTNGTLPPHLRAAAKLNGTASLPPHLRKSSNSAPVTNGNVDIMAMQAKPAPEATPPSSPKSQTLTFQAEVPLQSIEKPYAVHSGKDWMPYAVTNLPELGADMRATIPSPEDTVTFSLDFLNNTFGGSFWSPGLKYVPPNAGPCPLVGRSYYLLDAGVEPYLPRAPGQHGAKLTAFFNANPEEMYGDVAAGSFDKVPMFVCNNPWAPGDARRYVYYGNFSQTRWSDKLDYDRMVEQVPGKVKSYWAEELSATTRPDWLTEALKKHFFPMPEYEGLVIRRRVEGSVEPEEGDEAKAMAKAMSDMKKHIELLRDWDEDATLKTRLIKKDFILQAFERADADDPPALRLWWEYLQCTSYDRSLYNMLVDLQSRHSYYL